MWNVTRQPVLPEEPAGSRRRLYRTKVLKKAKVVFSGWTTFDCEVRDLTEDGARLEFKIPVQLPPDFKLIIGGSKKVSPVTLVWQRRLEAGVKFIGPEEDVPAGKLFTYWVRQE